MASQTDLRARTLFLGNGAQFWVDIVPSNDTAQWVPKWAVTFQQQDGNWSETITSDNPTQVLQTPNLSGTFNVTVWGGGPKFSWQQLTPQLGSRSEVGCNSNCAAMVGIVATPDGSGANFWTVWDATCDR